MPLSPSEDLDEHWKEMSKVDWAVLDPGVLPLIASRLQGKSRDVALARLVCCRWGAEIPQGISKLDVKGKGPTVRSWRLLCGLEELKWTSPSEIAEAAPLAKLRCLRLRSCNDDDLHRIFQVFLDDLSLELLHLGGRFCENVSNNLRKLGHLSALISLDLGNCGKITDAGIKVVGRISALTSLNLNE